MLLRRDYKQPSLDSGKSNFAGPSGSVGWRSFSNSGGVRLERSTMGRFAGRFISSVLLAGLIPACGGGPGSSPPPASATALFFEGWDSRVPPGGGPSSQWTGFLATGNGTLAGG